MGRTTTVLVLLLAIFATAFGAKVTYLPDTIVDNTLQYGVESNYINVVSDSITTPTVDNQITIVCTNCIVTDPVDAKLNYPASSGLNQYQSFRIIPTAADPTQVQISFTMQNTAPTDFQTISPVAFKALPGEFDNDFTGEVVGVMHTATFNPLQSPLQGVTVTLGSSGSVVQFTPATFTFEDDTPATVQYRSTRAGDVNITFTLSGSDKNNYANPGPILVTFDPLYLDIDINPVTLGSPTYGQPMTVHVYEDSGYNPVSALKITPTAPGATFSPASTTLVPVTSPFSSEFTFSMTPTSIGEFNVSFAYAGADALTTPDTWYELTQKILVDIAPLAFDSQFPGAALKFGEFTTLQTAELNYYPLNDVTVTPHSDNNNLVFEPASFQFGANTRVVNYRVKPVKMAGASFNVYFTVSGTDAAFIAAPSNETTSISFPEVSVPSSLAYDLTPGRTGVVGQYPVSISIAPTSTLTLYINTTNPALYSVSPAFINFGPSTPLTATFSLSALTGVAPSTAVLFYTLGGPASDFYSLSSSTTSISNDLDLSVYVPDDSWTITMGETVGPFTVVLEFVPTTTFTVALSTSTSVGGSALTFTPATLTFNPTTWTAQYWVVGNVVSSVEVTYTINAAGSLYSVSGTTDITVVARDSVASVQWKGPTTFDLNVPVTVPLYLPNAPLTGSSVSVQMVADDVTFAPNPVVFTAGASWATVTVTGTMPSASTSVSMNFPNNAAYTDTPVTQTIKVNGISLTVPSSLPALSAAGEVSSPFNIQITGKTAGLTVTLSAAGVTFNPAQVVFNAGDSVKTFTYTASVPILANTPVTFTLSGADAKYLATPAPISFTGLVLDLQTVSIYYPNGDTYTVNDAFYGYAVIHQPTPGTLTVTPKVTALPGGPALVFTPNVFTFTGTTTTVAFKVLSSAISDSESDMPFTVNYQLGGADAGLYESLDIDALWIEPYGYPTITVPTLSVGSWVEASFSAAGNSFQTDVTVTLTATPAGLSFSPATFVVPANTKNVAHKFSVKAASTGIYQITATISGAPSSFTPQVTSTVVVSAPIIGYTWGITVGGENFVVGDRYGPFSLTMDNLAGPVTVTPVAQGQLTFEPSTFSFGGSNNAQTVEFFVTATEYTNQPVYVTYTMSGASKDSYAAITEVHQVTVDNRGLSCSMNGGSTANLIVGVTKQDILKCTFANPVVNGLTITPTGSYLTFSPASVTVTSDMTEVYFSATPSNAVRYSTQQMYDNDASIRVNADVSVSGDDADWYQFDPIHYSNIYVGLRSVVFGGADFSSTGAYWGDSIELEFNVDYPVISSLVLTPKEDRYGLVFTPASITLVPGRSFAAFTLYLDPSKMVGFASGSNSKLAFSLVLGGGDLNTTTCNNDDNDYDCSFEISTLYAPVVTVGTPPHVAAYEEISPVWTITVPRVPNGFTITPVTKGDVTFTPATWVFAAGDTRKSIQYTVHSDSNGAFPINTNIPVDLILTGADANIFHWSFGTMQSANLVVDNTGYSVSVSYSTTSVNVWDPFTISFDAANHFIEDVTELIINVAIPGATVTPASVTISAAAPRATVTAVVNSIPKAFSPYDSSSFTVTPKYAFSGADAAKFSLPSTTSITVYRHTVYFDSSIGSLKALDNNGPFSFSIDTIPPSPIYVNFTLPVGVTMTPSSTFALDANNLVQNYWIVVDGSKFNPAQDFRIIANLYGAASDAYYLDSFDTLMYNDAVTLRSISVPSITSVDFYPAYYTVTLDAPVNGLTITPSAQNLVFTPAQLNIAPGQTSASFSVVASSPSKTVITYTISGADAGSYNTITSSYPVSAPALFEFSSDIMDDNIEDEEGFSTIEVSDPPPTGVTLTPTAANVVFSPASWEFSATSTSIAFTYKFTGKTNAYEFVTFSVTGADAAWFKVPAPVYVQTSSNSFNVRNADGDSLNTDALTVGVPAIGYAKLRDTNLALPAVGKTVTLTPHSAQVQFTPASWTFDSNTPTVRFSYVGTLPNPSATIYFTVDDDENYYAPNSINIQVDAAEFLGGHDLNELTNSFDSDKRIASVIFELPAAMDIQITPVALFGDMTFEPAVIDFSTSFSAPFTVNFGVNNGQASSNSAAKVGWKIAGSDAAKFKIDTLAPTGFTIINNFKIDVPTSDITLVAGEPYTFAVYLSNYNGLPTDSVTVDISANGLTVEPSSVTLSATSQFTFVTITANSYTIGSWQNKLVLHFTIDPTSADADKFYLASSQVRVQIDQAAFVLPSLTDNYIVGHQYGPFTAYVPYASIADVTLTPTSTGIVFTDAADSTQHSLVFSADRLYVDFYFTPSASAVHNNDVNTVAWAVTGTDSWAYSAISPDGIVVSRNSFDVASLQETSVYFSNSGTIGPLLARLNYPIVGATSVVLTPSAPGVVFAPSSATFDSTHDTAEFSMTLTQGASVTNPVVSFTVAVTGNEDFDVPAPFQFTAVSYTGVMDISNGYTPPLSVVVGEYGATSPYRYLLSLSAATQNGLVVTPSAPGVVFSPAIFEPGMDQAFFSILSVERAFDTDAIVSFEVSGDDADLYVTNIDATTVDATFKSFGVSSFSSLRVGKESATYSLWLVGGAPSESITITPWGPGLVFSPATFEFGPSDANVDFTITADAAGISQNDVPISFFVSGPSQYEFDTANLQGKTVAVRFWNLQADWCGTSPLIVGVPSCTVTVSYSSPINIEDVTITPVAFGMEFEPATFTLSADIGVAQFTIIPQVSSASTTYVDFEASGPGAKYLSTNSLLDVLSFTVKNRTINIPDDFGQNYVGVESNAVLVSLNYLPVTGNVTITPVAPGATFTPSSLTFVPTSAPYASFTFVHQLVTGAATKVRFLLSGSEAMYYDFSLTAADDTAAYTPKRRVIDVSASTAQLVPGQSGYIDISIQYAPTTELVVNMLSALDLPVSSVTFTPTTTSARITVSSDTPSATAYKVFFRLTGEDAWMFSQPSDSAVTFTVNPLSFTGATAANMFPSTTFVYGQQAATFTIKISSGHLNQAVSLIPYSPYFVFTPAVFEFDANTQFVTGTYEVTSQALRATTLSQTVSWSVAGPGAALITVPSSFPVSVVMTGNPYYSLSLSPTTVSVPVGLESQTFGFTALVPPPESITITPFVNVPGVTIDPPSITLTPTSVSAVFTAVVSFVGSATVSFDITGPSASLYNLGQKSLSLTSTIRTFTTPTGSLGSFAALHNSSIQVISLAQEPATSVTLTLINPSGSVTISPNVLTFTPSALQQAFSVRSAASTGTESIYYSLSGPDAQYYQTPAANTVSFSAITTTLSIPTLSASGSTYTMVHGYAREISVTVNTAPIHDLTFTLSAAGFEFSGPIVIPAGAYRANGLVKPVGYSTVTASPVRVQISGIDAAVFSTPSVINLVSTALTFNFAGDLNSNTELDIGVPQSLSVSINEIADDDLSFACVSSGFDVPALVIPAGHLGATVTAIPTTPGHGSVECFLQGVQTAFYTGSFKKNYHVNYRRLTQTSGDTAAKAVTVGGWTAPFNFRFSAGSSGASVPAQESLNISFVVSPAGAVIFDPPAVYVASPSSSFAFRASPQALGLFKVTLVVTGADAELFDPSYPANTVYGSITVEGKARSISVMQGTSATDRVITALDYENENYDTQSYLRLFVGVESRPITVSVGAIPTNVAVVLEGNGLTFNPSVLRFTGTYESLTFTVTATEAYSNAPTFIHFTVTGDDAALFGSVSPRAVYTAPLFEIPDFPLMTINQPITQQITVKSAITAPILLTPSVGGVVFIPEQLLFTPDKPTATFQVVGVAVSNTPNGDRDGQNIVQFYWRYMSDTAGVNNQWFPRAGDVSINVQAGAFIINFPHLQIGTTSTVTVSTTVPPRSDVVLTFVGNNLNFNPPSLLLTKSNNQASVQVTPVHSDYQTSQNIPFSVDYIVSGSNANDFITPYNSKLAVSRGSAPQADSLVLSSASTAVASVFVLIAAMFALLL